MSDVDRCVTKAYDARLINQDPKPILEQCSMASLHQFVLDCGATFTNELFKLTKLSFLPFMNSNSKEGRDVSQQRIAKACLYTPPKPKPVEAPPAASSTPSAAAQPNSGSTSQANPAPEPEAVPAAAPPATSNAAEKPMQP